jgi:lipopolysaccharide export LptBFGC system permease protein LptF
VERSIELGKLLEDIKSRITGLDGKTQEANDDILKQRAKMQQDEAEAKEVERELSERRAQKARFQQELRGQQEARNGAVDQEDLRSLLIRIHKRLAQAFAVFAFAMIGMPLGMMTRRRSVMVAFGVSFAIVLALFYPFLVIGQMAAESGLLPTVPAMWSGNIVISAIGVLLTARALRQ